MAAEDAPDYINVVVSSDSSGEDSTEHFDVTGFDDKTLPYETVAVNKTDGSAAFSVKNKATGGARNGFYTIMVISGRKQTTGGLAAMAEDGEVLATQKFKIADASQETGSGGGSGGCDAGAGLAAAAALAAIAIRRRNK